MKLKFTVGVLSTCLALVAQTATIIQVPNTLYTLARALSSNGDVTGEAYDPVAQHSIGFVRQSDGTFTTFDLGHDLQPAGINSSRSVIGIIVDSVSLRGFPWAAAQVTDLNVPGATATIPERH